MDFRIATKAAKDFLSKNNVCEFPVDVFGLAKCNGWDVVSFDDIKKIAPEFAFFIDVVMKSSSGAVVGHGHNRKILYNSQQSAGRVRFTVAHEIGHIVLENEIADDDEMESLCDAFAANLLSPFEMIAKFEVKNTYTMMKVFGITREASKNRLNNFYKYVTKLGKEQVVAYHDEMMTM